LYDHNGFGIDLFSTIEGEIPQNNHTFASSLISEKWVPVKMIPVFWACFLLNNPPHLQSLANSEACLYTIIHPEIPEIYHTFEIINFDFREKYFPVKKYPTFTNHVVKLTNHQLETP